MTRPIIGITSGEIRNAKLVWAPYVYGQTHTYVEAVKAAGGLPLILPIVSDQAAVEHYAELVDGMLFAGGNDIEPRRYDHEVTHARDMSTARDEFELALFRELLARDKPALGICRGMQLFNVAYGGTLHQDIAALLPDTLDHQASQREEDFETLAHQLEIIPGSQLADIMGEAALTTNSLHHQAVDQLGEGLTIGARSPDGVIEAIEDTSRRFVIGIQSHPEALFTGDERWQALFKTFVARTAMAWV